MYIISIRKRCFSPNSSLRSECNPREVRVDSDIIYMPAIKFLARFDLGKNLSFPDGNYIGKSSAARGVPQTVPIAGATSMEMINVQF